MDIIIGLFGVMFLLFKLFEEKADEIISKNRTEKIRTLEDKYEVSYETTKELTNQIKDSEKRKILVDEIREDLIYIYGEEKAASITQDMNRQIILYDNLDWWHSDSMSVGHVILSLILAKRGKVGRDVLYRGFRVREDSEEYDTHMRAIKRIEEILVEYSSDLKLYLKPREQCLFPNVNEYHFECLNFK